MAESFYYAAYSAFSNRTKKNDRSGVYMSTLRMCSPTIPIELTMYINGKADGISDRYRHLTSEDALIRAKDVEEMTGHFLMFNEMLKTYKEPLCAD